MSARASLDQDPVPPTIDDIRQWPATVDVPTAGQAFGIGRTHAYDLARRGEFPVRVVKVGRRHRVITSELLTLLGAADFARPAPGTSAGVA